MSSTDITEVPEPNSKDYAYAVFKGLISEVPIVGGTASEVLSLLVTPPLSKRQDEWMETVVNGLLNLRRQIEDLDLEDLSENETFITTVMHASQAAVRNHQTEKIEALRNAVLNSALPDAPEDALQQMFLNFVNDLTAWHLKMLKFFDNPRAWGEKYGIEYTNWHSGSPASVLEEAFPELKSRRNFYDRVVQDLVDRGLMRGGLHTTMTSRGMFESRTTDMGQQFLGFVVSPIEEV